MKYKINNLLDKSQTIERLKRTRILDLIHSNILNFRTFSKKATFHRQNDNCIHYGKYLNYLTNFMGRCKVNRFI